MDESEKGVLTQDQFERALGYCHMFLNNQELETSAVKALHEVEDSDEAGSDDE